jgi:hypothetical protein
MTQTILAAVNVAIQLAGPIAGPSQNRGGGPPDRNPPGGWPFTGGNAGGAGPPVGPPGGPPIGPLAGPPGGPPLALGPIIPPAPQGFHNERLTGNPPTAFNGNQSCSRDFMDEWNLYYLNNRFNTVFATPFQ